MVLNKFDSRVAIALSGLILALFAARTAAQTAVPVTESQAREWATYAAGKAGGDAKIFDQTFMNLVRILAPSYRADPFSIGVPLYSSDELTITAVGPVSNFQLEISEAVRKFEPIDKVPWPCGVGILVSPSQIDSPDIERIVVKRGGQIVEPITNGLVSTSMTTRLGVTVTKRKGVVCFSPSTFAPGAEVTVIGVPVSGSNITKVLTDAELRMLP